MLRELNELHEFKQRYPRSGRVLSAALLVPVILSGYVILLAAIRALWTSLHS